MHTKYIYQKREILEKSVWRKILFATNKAQMRSQCSAVINDMMTVVCHNSNFFLLYALDLSVFLNNNRIQDSGRGIL